MSDHCAGQEVAASPKSGPREQPLVLLLGRPNSGKSSLFNRITGRDAHVANFPGVTVDILEADVTLPGGEAATIADLPGLYALDALTDPTTDEGVARTFLEDAAKSGRPMVLAQVIDGTQMPLGLRLTRDLVRRGLKLLLLVTQRDVLDHDGRKVDIAALSETVGAPAIVVSSREPAARAEVLKAIEEALADAAAPSLREGWSPDDLGARVVVDAEPTLDTQKRRSRTERIDAWLLQPVLGPLLFLALTVGIFAAVFLIADPVTGALDAIKGALGTRITARLGEGKLASFLSAGVLDGAGTVLAFMPQIVILTIALELLEATGYLARGAFLVDRLLQLLGLSGRSFFPLLMGHACAVPAITATRIVRDPRERLTAILVIPLMTCSARIPTYALILTAFFAHRSALFRSGVFVSLYFAGMLAGLVASLVLRRTAMRGRSLPLVLEMPAYRAPQARVIAQKAGQAAWRFLRDVGTTILIASIVLWGLLTLPMPGSSSSSPAPAASAAQIESAPAPSSAKPADTAAPAAPESTPIAPESAEKPRPIEHSVAAAIGRALEPVTAPIGFDWRINVSLIGSFGARELMVGTMGVIMGLENASEDPAPLSHRLREARRPDGTLAYSTRTGLALLAFFVIACQCMSTVAAIRRETKTWRWPAFVLAYTYTAAYVAAFVVYRVAGLWVG
ncbi:Ferrous iron transport protein B [Minicystis rosea]|nr:Ferrous iron transport protein B [Minicystis rosea]